MAAAVRLGRLATPAQSEPLRHHHPHPNETTLRARSQAQGRRPALSSLSSPPRATSQLGLHLAPRQLSQRAGQREAQLQLQLQLELQFHLRSHHQSLHQRRRQVGQPVNELGAGKQLASKPSAINPKSCAPSLAAAKRRQETERETEPSPRPSRQVSGQQLANQQRATLLAALASKSPVAALSKASSSVSGSSLPTTSSSSSSRLANRLLERGPKTQASSGATNSRLRQGALLARRSQRIGSGSAQLTGSEPPAPPADLSAAKRNLSAGCLSRLSGKGPSAPTVASRPIGAGPPATTAATKTTTSASAKTIPMRAQLGRRQGKAAGKVSLASSTSSLSLVVVKRPRRPNPSQSPVQRCRPPAPFSLESGPSSSPSASSTLSTSSASDYLPAATGGRSEPGPGPEAALAGPQRASGAPSAAAASDAPASDEKENINKVDKHLQTAPRLADLAARRADPDDPHRAADQALGGAQQEQQTVGQGARDCNQCQGQLIDPPARGPKEREEESPSPISIDLGSNSNSQTDLSHPRPQDSQTDQTNQTKHQAETISPMVLAPISQQLAAERQPIATNGQTKADETDEKRDEEEEEEEELKGCQKSTAATGRQTTPVPIRLEPINDFYDLEARPFARGEFAQVKRCINKNTKKCFAAKCIKKRRRLVDIRHEILLEIEALQLSQFTEHIVKIYEVYESPTEMILVLEMANGGELQRVLDDEEFLEEELVRKMVRQILDGLIHLHDNEIAHLDIKPQNLLLTEPYPKGDVKLCDFGISRRITKNSEIRGICGTPDYVAPEILQYDPISLATDMWSVGVLTYVLLSGYSPFGSESKPQTFCNITQATLDFPSEIFDEISEEAIDFVKKLIVREPIQRLTSRQARQHHWLTR